MALATNTAIPSAPTIYAVYRGFYVLPTDTLSASINGVDFFVARSTDDIDYPSWQYLGRGNNTSGFYWVHSGLDENMFYAYYVQYIYTDGSKSAVGQIGNAGQAQLMISSTLNIDQLASRAYSTGLVTAGIFRGVIFETSATDPKVRMDPSGIFATDISHNQVIQFNPSSGLSLSSGTNQYNMIDWFLGNLAGPQLAQISVDNASGDGEVFIAALSSTLKSSYISLQTSHTLDSVNLLGTTILNAAGSRAYQPTIMDGTGASSFVQLSGSVAKTLITWGIFTTGTGVINNAGSGDWTLSGLGAGQATVNFATRATNPAVTATVATNGGFNAYAEAINIGTSNVIIASLNGATAPPALINAIVSFIIIG